MTLFTPEEKKRILIGLKSSVIATRFMTIKYLSDIADNKSMELSRLELEDPITLEEICAIMRFLESNDRDKMVREQAKVFLEKLKLVQGSEQKHLFLKCNKCMRKMTFGWIFCPHCGKRIEPDAEVPNCPSCDTKIDGGWEFCANCGGRLKEKILVTICTRCGRDIDQSWSLCPFCGKNLKS